MDLPKLKAMIEALPPDSVTKTILDGLLQQVTSIGNSLGQVQAVQAQNTINATASKEPPHPYGLCRKPECQSCITQAQEIISHGRKAMVGDLDEAFVWANRPDLADSVASIFEEWAAAGRPKTAKAETQ